jgi:hypothetical protein
MTDSSTTVSTPHSVPTLRYAFVAAERNGAIEAIPFNLL